MNKWVKVLMLVSLALAFVPAMPAQAQTDNGCTFFGIQDSGAKYCISQPPNGFWNGDLVIFAHGYEPVSAPLDIPWKQMTFINPTGGTITLPQVVNSMGFGFATTSYSVNGLAVKQGIADVLDLINVFTSKVGKPTHVYLVGASEGGLVTTLAIEKYPAAFSGGMELCGPVGSFTGQVNYWGDFRVVFDYFMDTPDFNVLPGTAVNIPPSLMSKWDSVYVPRIGSTLTGNLPGTQQMLSVTQAPIDLANPLITTGETTLGILWYNVFATEDAINKLGGQPYNNRDRVYSGSLDDTSLNAGVKRFKADPAALAEIAANYETRGVLLRPLVAMHTTGDPIVPFWQMKEYSKKVAGVSPFSPYLAIPVARYGHCAFNLTELLGGFSGLITLVTGYPPLLANTSSNFSDYMLER